MRPRDLISCTLWNIIYTAVYGRRQCSNFARALHLSREFVPAKRICSCEENCRQTYTDWTAVSPKQQKQESLTCFIRFYLTVAGLSFTAAIFLTSYSTTKTAIRQSLRAAWTKKHFFLIKALYSGITCGSEGDPADTVNALFNLPHEMAMIYEGTAIGNGQESLSVSVNN